MTEPRTKPPPVTRSSSAMPEEVRGASCVSPASPSSGKTRPLARDGRVATGPAIGLRGAGFLDDRVPAAAGLALALPAVVDGAAALADEGGVALGHVRRLPPTIGPRVAAAEAGQDLVADGAGAGARPRRSVRSSPIRVARSPRRTAPAGTSVTSTDDEVHGDAAGERAAAAGDDRLADGRAGRDLGVGGARGARIAVGVADREGGEPARAARRPLPVVADALAGRRRRGPGSRAPRGAPRRASDWRGRASGCRRRGRSRAGRGRRRARRGRKMPEELREGGGHAREGVRARPRRPRSGGR